MRAAISTAVNIAPRGCSWVGSQLVGDESGSLVRGNDTDLVAELNAEFAALQAVMHSVGAWTEYNEPNIVMRREAEQLAFRMSSGHASSWAQYSVWEARLDELLVLIDHMAF